MLMRMRWATKVLWASALMTGCASPSGATAPVPPATVPPATVTPTGISAPQDQQLTPRAPEQTTDSHPVVAPAGTLPLPRLGLRRRDFDDPYGFEGTGHMTQLSLMGDLAFVANSFSSITTYRLADDGTLEFLALSSSPALRCTTVAGHARSQTVFCAAPDPSDLGAAGRVRAYDVSDPANVQLRSTTTTDAGPIGSLAISGALLYAAAGPGGLLQATIGAAGALSNFATLYAGNAVTVDANSTHTVLLDLDRGLLLLAPGAGTQEAALPLEGAPLAVRLVDDRALVALGSEGVRVLDVSGGAIRSVAEVHPQCVADAADLQGDMLAVGCLTGVYLYDLADSPVRLVGFEPASAGVRDLRFAGDDLVVADFSRISRLAVDRGGAPLSVDASWNAPFDNEGVAHVGIRNEGSADVLLDVFLDAPGPSGRPMLTRVTVPGRGELRVAFEASEITSVLGHLPTAARLWLSPVDFRRLRIAGQVLPGQQTMTEVLLLQADSSARARLRPGDGVPSLGFRDALGQPITVRPAPARLVIYQPDCALMWPELMELAWQTRHGSPAHPAMVVASFIDGRLVAYLGLDVFPGLEIGDGAILWPDGSTENLGYDLYDRYLAVEGSRGGAHWPTDYIVDADGRVSRIERAYRGRWPL